MYSTLLCSVGNYLKLIDEEIALEAFIRKNVQLLISGKKIINNFIMF